MKAGIITFNGAHNYGAIIQAYALQEFLKTKDLEVEIINYRLKEIQRSYRLIKHKKRKNPIKDKVILVKEHLKLDFCERYKYKKRDKFEYFINNVLNVTPEYKTIEDLENANLDHDILICGSDQIWNYNLTKGIKPAFFLEFGRADAKRIAYAASMGIEEINKEYEDVYRRYLKNLDYIGVREASAKRIIEKLTPKKVEEVVDPTLLVDKEVYDKIKVDPKYKQKYIYMHMLVEDENLIEIVNEESKRLGIPVVHNKPKKIFDNEIDHATYTGPKEFLGLISNAEYVFTNSFHATVLSIIYHKNFITVPHKKYPTRMVNLLSKLDLTDHLISEYSEDLKIENIPINYENVDKLKNIEREKSIKFLDNAINNNKCNIDDSYLGGQDRFSCYGCTACASICPKNAITMVEDEEGFIYPEIDKEKCIECGLCKKVCIYKKQELFNKEENKVTYAAYIQDDDIRKNSTSGGVFTGLYKQIIAKKGYVIGVKLDDNMNAVYDIAKTEEECEKFRGAKYVRAEIGDIYERTKKILEENKPVLFSGTPCCIAGLKSFLGKEYDNLYLIDIVCHSNSSPKVYREYIKRLEEIRESKIVDIKFRDKEKEWRDSNVIIKFEDGTELKQSVYKNDYTANFLLGNMSRPSCYNCEFSRQSRTSDITIGDYWGININHQDMDDKKGTSLVIVNTAKGKELFENIENFKVKETDNKEGLRKNHSRPIAINEVRSKFFEEKISGEKPINKLLRKYNKRRNKKGKGGYVKIKTSILFGNMFTRTYRKKDYIGLTSFCIHKNKKNTCKIKDTYFVIGQEKYKPKFWLGNGLPIIKGYKLNFYKVKFPIDTILNNTIQNKVYILGKNKKGNDELNPIVYNLFDLRRGKDKNGKIFTTENKTSIYFRQSSKNGLYLTIRETVGTDSRKEQLKINLAYYLSKLIIKKNIILLFEKECNRYEESTTAVYEKLIDEGYKNVYYILNKNYEHMDVIKDKYKKNIIDKFSLRHYIYFFRCKKFIGTESLSHVIDLRVANKHATHKIHNRNISYVFLQHGVMYMVSLDSELRRSFRKKERALYRVVVSSKKERDHFVELGGYNEKDMYVCGLPKYDKNQRNENADKIVIMLTWRRWEYNQARANFKETNYYKLISKIVDSIPEEYKDKIIVLPHPLILREVKASGSDINKYIPENFRYDDILKDTNILITDYSSISYDAFYRGANIIFCWEEKDECIEKYGKSAKLMLNEDNVFGDICYDAKEIYKLIKNNYGKKQSKIYKDRYKEIVEFDDGKNTERLIEMMKKDGVV